MRVLLFMLLPVLLSLNVRAVSANSQSVSWGSIKLMSWDESRPLRSTRVGQTVAIQFTGVSEREAQQAVYAVADNAGDVFRQAMVFKGENAVVVLGTPDDDLYSIHILDAENKLLLSADFWNEAVIDRSNGAVLDVEGASLEKFVGDMYAYTCGLVALAFASACTGSTIGFGAMACAVGSSLVYAACVSLPYVELAEPGPRPVPGTETCAYCKRVWEP